MSIVFAVSSRPSPHHSRILHGPGIRARRSFLLRCEPSSVQNVPVNINPEAARSGGTPRRRGGVVLIEDGRVALIRRHRGGRLYHLFPGGGVEVGESDETAAIREALEELGVHVQITRLLGTVAYGTATQVYFEVCATGGEFGTGDGPEMSSPADSEVGSYEPIWLRLDELADIDVRPAALASMLASSRLPASPFEIVEG